MKTKLALKFAGAFLLSTTLGLPLSTVFGQGTAFTYQGQLYNNGSPASGTYNLQFSLFNTNTGGAAVAGPVTTNNVTVTNGLFTVLMDFGPGLFTRTNYWLEIGVETNGAGSFSTLAPRQQLTPTPYAIYAETVTASGISGTLLGTQLLHDAVTINAGSGLSGGGQVALGNAITLTNTGVLSVTGNTDITAVMVGGAVTLGDTATTTDTPGTLVKRDGSGNFSAATIMLDGDLNLPGTTATTGIINSGGVTLVHAFGLRNFFAGPGAGNLTMSGYDNTAVGFQVLSSNTSGSFNTANGTYALAANTSGFQNTANGFAALFSNTSGSDNTASGYEALYANTNGSQNTANGNSALYASTSGSANTANGYASLSGNTSGYNNTANGAVALKLNTSGYGNTASGYASLFFNTNGFYNVANGYEALFYNANGSYNTAVGTFALQLDSSAFYNTAIGAISLVNLVTGNNNTALGYGSLNSLTNGDGNIALGDQAGHNVLNGANNIEIGNTGGASDNNTIRIGTTNVQTSTFIAGIFGTTVSGSAVIVNSSGQLGVAPSSRRFKQDIHTMDDASRVLLSLRPVTFKYKPGIDPQGTPQFGLVAEEVAKVDPDLVVRDAKAQIFTVRYDAVNAMLLNEFLKEHRTVQELGAQIQQLKQQLDKLEQLIGSKNGSAP